MTEHPQELTLNLLLVDGHASTITALVYQRTITAHTPGAPARLVSIALQPQQDGVLAFTELQLFPARTFDGAVYVDRQCSLPELEASARDAIRALLQHEHWLNWAVSPAAFRMALGAPDEPLTLTEAARQCQIALTTLASAAKSGRLPTIVSPSGPRQVYAVTIDEARARGRMRRPYPRRTAHLQVSEGTKRN